MILFVMLVVFVLAYWLQPIFFSPREKYGLSTFTYFIKRVFNSFVASIFFIFLLAAFGVF